ncbi:transcriptional regulator, MarR family [Renibacterium salmoninarum ATCC 33209]|uniref:Transcriptional regulator, MarR family n=1 Tax=Renibacterium salmoninarum (strain ATCC 33209 / DSM 20767 / JCM 11484 / NBRC 15589 / NCIMB 2235) TaxID=288705 RepID=A9WQ41_RENSM|nr:MarR family transcriptional regulator [Renibacterium salmoninarum]ABY22467.1 transcriptional regulator, MarR family [Renibacterium salmoninarum ATCC 33209]
MTTPKDGRRQSPSPSKPGVEKPDEAVIEAAEAQLSLLWRRSRAVSYQLAREIHPDLDPAAYGLLAILAREGSMRLTDLAANIGVGKPSVSRQIAFLEKIELVHKLDDPLDGRAQLINLTARGTKQIVTVQSARKKAMDDRLAAWSPEDVRHLARLLGKFNDEFESSTTSSKEETS